MYRILKASQNDNFIKRILFKASVILFTSQLIIASYTKPIILTRFY